MINGEAKILLNKRIWLLAPPQKFLKYKVHRRLSSSKVSLSGFGKWLSINVPTCVLLDGVHKPSAIKVSSVNRTNIPAIIKISLFLFISIFLLPYMLNPLKQVAKCIYEGLFVGIDRKRGNKAPFYLTMYKSENQKKPSSTGFIKPPRSNFCGSIKWWSQP